MDIESDENLSDDESSSAIDNFADFLEDLNNDSSNDSTGSSCSSNNDDEGPNDNDLYSDDNLCTSRGLEDDDHDDDGGDSDEDEEDDDDLYGLIEGLGSLAEEYDPLECCHFDEALEYEDHDYDVFEDNEEQYGINENQYHHDLEGYEEGQYYQNSGADLDNQDQTC